MDQEAKTLMSVTPLAASALLKTGTRVLLDVRNPDERALCMIEPSLFIPLHEIEERLDELPRDQEIIVYCHHGSRGNSAAGLLCENRFRAKNMQGGIDAWSLTIDNRIARY